MGQEASHIDAIGRGELHLGVKFFVHESILDEGLAVIENAIDLDCRNVLAKRCELAFLNRTDFSFGIKHIDMNAFYAQETVSYSRTGVATRGNKDIDRPLLTPP